MLRLMQRRDRFRQISHAKTQLESHHRAELEQSGQEGIEVGWADSQCRGKSSHENVFMLQHGAKGADGEWRVVLVVVNSTSSNPSAAPAPIKTKTPPASANTPNSNSPPAVASPVPKPSPTTSRNLESPPLPPVNATSTSSTTSSLVRPRKRGTT